jgi:hypothetical protein
VYDVSRTLTLEQRATALFWADGAGTFTPPGHWNAIASQLLRTHAARVLSRFFPREARRLRARAREAAVSRLYAGIHFRSDNEAGLRVGAAAGRAALAVWPKHSR